MAAVHAWAYRHTMIHQGGLKTIRHRALWCMAIILYTIIISGVAIQFPWGLAAALVFLVVYGFGVVGLYVYRLEGSVRWALGSWGKRPVLQYFLWSYVLSFIIVIAWIAKNKGFESRNT